MVQGSRIAFRIKTLHTSSRYHLKNNKPALGLFDKLLYIWAIGCIFAELLTTKPLFPGKEKDPKNPSLFQDDQVSKIFKILGKPTPATWPDVVHLPGWRRVSSWEPYVLFYFIEIYLYSFILIYLYSFKRIYIFYFMSN